MSPRWTPSWTPVVGDEPEHRADWSTPAFDLPPTAPGTGPFTSREFLRTWWEHRAQPGDELLLIADDDALLPTLRRGDLVAFLGEQDLTDYHSPRGSRLDEAVRRLAREVPHGTRYGFNSLPDPAAGILARALAAVGAPPRVTRHEAAALLRLPEAYDDYLAGLGKKERHETRRKRRRFVEEVGRPRLVRAEGADAVRGFADLHRKAGGTKGGFMTTGMEEFFVALHSRAGALVDVLSGDDGAPVAAAFSFEDGDGYYLYNSAYDPGAGSASPGVVLIGMLIENAITRGKSVFDFLKGDEPYKFRLGAEERPLFQLTGVFEERT